MSNSVYSARTNYFRVKDEEAYAAMEAARRRLGDPGFTTEVSY